MLYFGNGQSLFQELLYSCSCLFMERKSDTLLTALIVDDESLPRAHLRKLLQAQDIKVVGEAGNSAEALQFAETLRPDLLFLDIQMPGLTGMQLASALQFSSANSQIIFVTGYSEHALEAFDRGALDYLLKPVSSERLAQALVRARSLLAGAQVVQQAALAIQEEATNAGVLQRLPIRSGYAVRLVRIEEIVWAKSREKRVIVVTREGEFPTYYTLTQLEALLPPDQFLRIHDSCIVRVNEIDEILFLGNHTYSVQLSSGQTLPVSRSRYAALQQRLGVEPLSAS